MFLNIKNTVSLRWMFLIFISQNFLNASGSKALIRRPKPVLFRTGMPIHAASSLAELSSSKGMVIVVEHSSKLSLNSDGTINVKDLFAKEAIKTFNAQKKRPRILFIEIALSLKGPARFYKEIDYLKVPALEFLTDDLSAVNNLLKNEIFASDPLFCSTDLCCLSHIQKKLTSIEQPFTYVSLDPESLRLDQLFPPSPTLPPSPIGPHAFTPKGVQSSKKHL